MSRPASGADGSTFDEFASLCFDAMASGIVQHERVLAGMMARVAPESTIVSAALDGLLEHWADAGECRVMLEGTHRGWRRVDVIVTQGAEEPLLVEWKLLWPHGFKECVGGIQRDQKKLAGSRGLVAVLAYQLSLVPPGCEGRLAPKVDVSLTDTVIRAEQVLEAAAAFRTSVRQFEHRGVAGQYQVLAWDALTAK